eukprot:277060_1
MSLLSGAFGSNDNVIHNPNSHAYDDNKSENKDDNPSMEPSKQPLYKIVQNVALYGMREHDFYALDTAVAHWSSLTYLMAAIWYQWDNVLKIWAVKDSYGTSNATRKIEEYMDFTHNPNQRSSPSIKRQSSLISYFTSFVSSETDLSASNKEEEEDEKTAAQNLAFLNDFFKFTELYSKTSGIKPIDTLEADDTNCNNLIVSLVWSVGFQCYFLQNNSMAQQTWKSLGVWYASVWFIRNATGTFVVHDNFGTSDSVRKICRFVNDAQETWNYAKKKHKMIHFESLNEDYMMETEETTTQGDDSKLCVVCLDGDRDHIIIPCGHICVCKKCKDLYTMDEATCPMCRTKVENVIKTFN